MAIKEIAMSKAPDASPVMRLVRGDSGAAILRMRVDRFDGGVDLAGLTWMVNVENAAGGGDVILLADVQASDAALCAEWLIGGVATAAAGDTTFSLMGVCDGDSAVIWQSGARVLRIYADVDASPGDVEEAQLSEVAQMVSFVSAELPAVLQARDAANTAADRAGKALQEMNGSASVDVAFADAAEIVTGALMQAGVDYAIAYELNTSAVNLFIKGDTAYLVQVKSADAQVGTVTFSPQTTGYLAVYNGNYAPGDTAHFEIYESAEPALRMAGMCAEGDSAVRRNELYNPYKYPLTPTWGQEYLAPWYEKVYAVSTAAPVTREATSEFVGEGALEVSTGVTLEAGVTYMIEYELTNIEVINVFIKGDTSNLIQIGENHGGNPGAKEFTPSITGVLTLYSGRYSDGNAAALKITEVQAGVTIVFEGDSITLGEDGGYRQKCVQNFMAAGGFPAERLRIVNNGAAGCSTQEWVGTGEYYANADHLTTDPNGVLDAAMAQSPDLLICAYGINDAVIGENLTIEARLKLFEANYREALDRIRGSEPVNDRPAYGRSAEELSVILCMPMNCNHEALYQPGRAQDQWHIYVRQILQRLCREYHCAFCDFAMLTYDATWSANSVWGSDTSAPAALHPRPSFELAIASALQPLVYPMGLWKLA